MAEVKKEVEREARRAARGRADDTPVLLQAAALLIFGGFALAVAVVALLVWWLV